MRDIFKRDLKSVIDDNKVGSGSDGCLERVLKIDIGDGAGDIKKVVKGEGKMDNNLNKIYFKKYINDASRMLDDSIELLGKMKSLPLSLGHYLDVATKVSMIDDRVNLMSGESSAGVGFDRDKPDERLVHYLECGIELVKKLLEGIDTSSMSRNTDVFVVISDIVVLMKLMKEEINNYLATDMADWEEQ